MFDQLPTSALAAMNWSWTDYEPYAENLKARELDAETVTQWLADWTKLDDLLSEVYSRLHVGNTANTLDEPAEASYQKFLDEVFPHAVKLDNALNNKLLTSGLEPEGFEQPLRKMRDDADLFREENIPLTTEHQKLGLTYNKIIGSQTVEWDGDEVTLTQLASIALSPDRSVREKAWRLASERVLEDRETINDNWRKLMGVRQKIAANTDRSYLDFVWQAKHRHDYTPEDCHTFHAAIEAVVVPAAARAYERRRAALGVDTLRPWDLSVNPMRSTDLGVSPPGQPVLKPFGSIDELATGAERMFVQVDPKVGGYFKTMRAEELLDLENRKGKAPGAYCTEYPVLGRPFIFENATGTHSDVQTLLHEAGHAFHVFESNHLPYMQQRNYPMEFAEVASMAMELLAAPYLTSDQGGFYTAEEAAQARIEHLDGILIFWPYMAVVDAFQHWIYANHEAASDPNNCDAKWAELWERYIVGVDYSGLEEEKRTGWHRKQHIHRSPLYYIEYGLAQLGAVQIWRNALDDQAGAVADYLNALELGGTASTTDLYKAAGVKFAFDAETLGAAVELIEGTISELKTML